MANEISPPFSYAKYLIGEEIILRSLNQQEDFADKKEYDATWNNNDRIEQSSMFFRSSILRLDFNLAGFEHCLPKPPCPWDKQGDDLKYDQFNDVIMGNDGIFTHRIEVFKRTDEPNKSGFQVGEKIMSYKIEQKNLKEVIRSEFSYYHRTVEQQGYKGKALVKVEKLSRGSIDSTFFYLFNFVE
jgi:hypothetical protein